MLTEPHLPQDGTATCTLLALLISPSLYSLWLTGPRCTAATQMAEGGCYAMRALGAPLWLLVGPLLTDEDTPNPWPAVLGIAIALGIGCQTIRTLRKGS